MEKTIQIKDLSCDLCGTGKENRVIYMIYPEVAEFKSGWLSRQADKYGVAIVMIYIPANQWNNYLTPWPEPGEEPDCPPFEGKASEFLSILLNEIMPRAEMELNLSPDVERDMMGVSLSGLFTLWQWMTCDKFLSIASLSGSFWFNGFIDWFDSKVSSTHKQGRAFFLLGNEEPRSRVKAFRPVGENTEKIVDQLSASGTKVEFVWVPGNHFTDPLGRAEKGLQFLATGANTSE